MRVELARGRERPVRLATVDEFSEEEGVVVGFIKVDFEGSGLAVATGAIEAQRRDWPMLSSACYHSFEGHLEFRNSCRNASQTIILSGAWRTE
jgi:hypothetical protein